MNDKAKAHFEKVDPVLFEALSKVGEFRQVEPSLPSEYFTALCRAVIGQQLSTKVARVIFKRFLLLFPEQKLTPKALLTIPQEKLRASGMSNAKVKFLLDLAQKVDSGQLSLESLSDLKDEEVILELTKIKGIGRWTAEMFLISSLGRLDVFSFGDLGLKRAIKNLYQGAESVQELEEITAKWSPYRSIACRILWLSLDNN